MRFIPVLLVSVALATSAGCFGSDDENGGDATPTPTTPTDATPTPTGTTPTATPTSPTPGEETPPPPPAPRELCAPSFDFSGNTQPGAPPTHTTTAACGAVPAGYTTITINGNFTATEPVMLAPTPVSVKVVDAAGTAVLTCSGPSSGAAATTPCTQEATVTAGEYTLLYEGASNLDFAGSVTIS